MIVSAGQLLGIILLALALGISLGWWARGGSEAFHRGVRRATIEDLRRQREQDHIFGGGPWRA